MTRTLRRLTYFSIIDDTPDNEVVFIADDTGLVTVSIALLDKIMMTGSMARVPDADE